MTINELIQLLTEYAQTDGTGETAVRITQNIHDGTDSEICSITTVAGSANGEYALLYSYPLNSEHHIG